MALVNDYCQKFGCYKSPMESCGYVVEMNGKMYQTVLSLLMFGKNPQVFLPTASVRIIRYERTEENTSIVRHQGYDLRRS